MKITCPQCNASLRVIGTDPGEVHQCPKCNTRFRAPAPQPDGERQRPATPSDDPFSDDWLSNPGQKPTPPAAAPPASPKAPTPTRPQPAAKPVSPPATTPAPQPTRPAAASPRPAPPPTPVPLSIPTPTSSAAPAAPTKPPADEPIPFDSDPLLTSEDDEAPPARPSGKTPSNKLPPPPPPAGHHDDDLPLAADADTYEFTVTCPVCATRMDLASTQVGKSIACPDCHQVFPILPPSRHERRTPTDKLTTLDEKLERLSVDDPSRAATVLSTNEAQRRGAEELLARAARALQEEEKEQRQGKFDDRATKALFSFFGQPTTITRMIALAVGGSITVALVTAAFARRGAADTGFSTFLLWSFAFPAFLIWLVAMTAHAMSILRDTANGANQVESWPNGPWEAFGSSLFALFALFYSAMPGAIVATVLPSVGVPFEISSLAVLISWYALYPIVLASMLADDSLFAPFSRRVFEALWASTNARGMFLTATAPLWLITFLLAWAVTLGSYLFCIPIAVGLVLLMFSYYRLLGWLVQEALQTLAESE